MTAFSLAATAVPALARSGIANPVGPATLYRMIRAGSELGRNPASILAMSAARWPNRTAMLDDEGANIYIELVEFDAYNLPNEALNSGDIDLNAFQHKAYLAKDCGANGYDLTVIGDTLIAPLCIYSEKYDSIDAIKEAADAK